MNRWSPFENKDDSDYEESEKNSTTFKVKQDIKGRKEVDNDSPSTAKIREEKNPLVKHKRNKLSVTDLSAQLWCEKQLEYTLITGYRKETEAMRAGTER